MATRDPGGGPRKEQNRDAPARAKAASAGRRIDIATRGPGGPTRARTAWIPSRIEARLGRSDGLLRGGAAALPSSRSGSARSRAEPRNLLLRLGHSRQPAARCCLERCRGLGRTRVQVRQPPAAAAPCPEKGQLPMTRSTRFRAAWRHAAPARNAGESLLMASRRRGAPHPPRLRRSDGARRTHAHPRHSMSECAWSCRGSEDPARMQRDSQLSATPDHGTDTVTLATVTSSV